MSLRTKITISVSGLLTLLMALLAFISFFHYEEQFKYAISSSQDTIVGLLANDIDKTLLAAQAQLVANARAVPDAALRNSAEAQRYLDSRVGLLAIFDNHIGLFSPLGIEIAESPNTTNRRGMDFSYRSYIKETVAKKKPVITDPYRSSQMHGHAAVMMTAPVFGRRGVMTGILVGSLDLTKDNVLGRIAKIRIGSTGYLYLTTADRTVIIHPRKERIFKQITPGMNRLYDRVINDDFQGTDDTVNYLGMDLLATFKRLAVNRWILAANYPKAEAFAPMQRAMRYFFFVAAAGIVGIFLSTWFLVDRFTRPLALLTRHVRELPRKQGDERMVGVDSDDEIGVLSRTFNGMLLQFDNQQKALAESEQRFRALADSLPQAVFETDSSGRFTYINKTALSMFAYTEDDAMQGVKVTDVIAEEDAERAVRNFGARLRGERTEQSEYLALRKDGSVFPCVVHSSPIEHNGAIVGLRGILVDISSRKKTEADLLRTQKLESLGILAGGIAHDFNNILTGIMGNLSLAKMGLEPDNPLSIRLEEAERAAVHARDLTHQLLTFSRGGAPVKKKIAPGKLIRDAATFAARGSKATMKIDIDAGLSPIEADQGQIIQVINNLVINACQALPDGGAVHVAARNERLEADTSSGLRAGDSICITVSDTGIGIPPEHIAKIFDPYFTTKPTGSGLGLAVVYSIIRNHGGDISAESRLGQGTVFTVRLPAVGKDGDVEAEETTAVSSGSGRILIMDDDEIVTSVLTAMLSRLGYETSSVKDGKEVIAQYRQALDSGRKFDAVIMDLTIPGGMGGRETVRELRAVDPGVKAVVSSGYSDDPVMADYQHYGFSAVMKKPFTVQEVSSVLRGLLSGDS